MDTFIGFITPLPWNWAPRDWAICAGQQIAVQQNAALYSLLGNQFGGNGQTAFNLPDLRGRMIIGSGQGVGLSNRVFAQPYGAEGVRLGLNNLPPHNHTLTASNTASTSLTQAPAANWTLGAAASVSADRVPVVTPVSMYSSATPATPVPSAPTSIAGDGQAVAITPPSLALNFCIALLGIYPSRD